MKPAEQRLTETRRQHSEAIVARHLSELFQRLPMLSGFSLRPDLEIADLSIFTWPGWVIGGDVYEAVTQSLADLAEERPEAIELLRGHTFAREFH